MSEKSLKLKPGLIKITAWPTKLHAIPTTFMDMLSMAQYYVNRLDETQDVVDLYPAVLATVHTVDWFVEGELKESLTSQTEQYENRFPIWKSLKDFANGLKHADRGRQNQSSARKLQAERSVTEWESEDAWDHMHRPNQFVWRIEHNGKRLSIYSLCNQFLKEFSGWALNKKPSTPT